MRSRGRHSTRSAFLVCRRGCRTGSRRARRAGRRRAEQPGCCSGWTCRSGPPLDENMPFDRYGYPMEGAKLLSVDHSPLGPLRPGPGVDRVEMGERLQLGVVPLDATEEVIDDLHRGELALSD